MLNYEANQFHRRSVCAATPFSVLHFISEVYQIRKEDTVADFFSGYGISTKYLLDQDADRLTSVEITSIGITIQEIKKKLMDLDDSYQIIQEDIFAYSCNHREQKYEFIFADIPWDLRLNDEQQEWKSDLIESSISKMDGNWNVMSIIMFHLKEKGKALVTVNNGIESSMSS